MRNIFGGLLQTLFLFLLVSNSYSQKIISDYDSLAIFKHVAIKNAYEIKDAEIKEVRFAIRNPKPITRIPKRFFGNLAEGIITLSTGITTDVEEEALWVSENELIVENKVHNWMVPLFFSGTYFKTRERVKNEDGSVSIENEQGVIVDWTKGAYGLILDKIDTLGKFVLITDLRNDKLSLDWIGRMESEAQDVYATTRKYETNKLNYDFVLQGDLRGNNFYVVTSGTHFRSLIIVNDKPVAIYQNHPDFVAISKKDRISPYLLLNKKNRVMESADMVRLVMLKNMMARIIRSDLY